MMGQHDRSEALFYYFRLEDQVPETHLLRLIEKHISFAFVREELKASYSDTGRPSIDPELLLRILLIGYLYGIGTQEPDRAAPPAVTTHEVRSGAVLACGNGSEHQATGAVPQPASSTAGCQQLENRKEPASPTSRRNRAAQSVTFSTPTTDLKRSSML